MSPAKQFKKRHGRDFHALANPIARAVNRARMEKWLSSRTAQIKQFKDGDDCAEFCASVLDELAVCLKSCEGWEVPDWVHQELLGAVEAIQRMASAGAYWDGTSADLIASALSSAVRITCRMPFETVAVGAYWVREAKDVAQGVAQGVAA
ncbi:hypothetical protein [Aquabacterium sp.]|uniref:hypothetical protein n=1 Tax=Aquabacterium sp. TaxID=1872578 RepID=UPI0035ADCB76